MDEFSKNLNTYFNLMTMNGGVYVFHTAKKIGALNALMEGADNVEAVATKCQLQKEPCRLLLDSLCGLGLLSKDGDSYNPQPVMMFLTGTYENLSNQYWDHLPTYLNSGVPIQNMDSVEESEASYTQQVKALEWMMKPSSEFACQILGFGSKRKKINILDVGAGAAVWSIQFLKADKDSEATALDWPNVLKVAKASAESEGVLSRMNFIEGNYHEVELEENFYDMVVLGNVTHLEKEENLLKLFNKLHSCLKENGEIVIFDVFSEQEQGRLASALYALGLGLRTKEARVYIKDELQSFLQQTQFGFAEFQPLAVPPYTMAMLVSNKK